VSRALLMGGTPSLAGNLTLLLGGHRSKPATFFAHSLHSTLLSPERRNSRRQPCYLFRKPWVSGYRFLPPIRLRSVFAGRRWGLEHAGRHLDYKACASPTRMRHTATSSYSSTYEQRQNV
jgi:hypothetical protein